MESDKNVKTLRWIEDHTSILDDDYENRVPKVQFQKNVKVKPYKPSNSVIGCTALHLKTGRTFQVLTLYFTYFVIETAAPAQ